MRFCHEPLVRAQTGEDPKAITTERGRGRRAGIWREMPRSGMQRAQRKTNQRYVESNRENRMRHSKISYQRRPQTVPKNLNTRIETYRRPQSLPEYYANND